MTAPCSLETLGGTHLTTKSELPPSPPKTRTQRNIAVGIWNFESYLLFEAHTVTAASTPKIKSSYPQDGGNTVPRNVGAKRQFETRELNHLCAIESFQDLVKIKDPSSKKYISMHKIEIVSFIEVLLLLLLLMLPLQPTVGFSLLGDFLPFRPFLTQFSPPSYSHRLDVFLSVFNPSFPWSSSDSLTHWIYWS